MSAPSTRVKLSDGRTGNLVPEPGAKPYRPVLKVEIDGRVHTVKRDDVKVIR